MLGLLVPFGADSVYVVVSDLDRRLPVLGSVGLLSEGGRALAMVEALADGFGVASTPSGKDVWFRVDRTGGPGRPSKDLDVVTRACGRESSKSGGTDRASPKWAAG